MPTRRRRLPRFSPTRPLRRLTPSFPLRGLFGPDAEATRHSLIALTISSLTAVSAGVALAFLEGTFAELPGLLVLVPAAIGVRGNIFGGLGSRLSTAIHTGTFSLTRRVDTVVGQNMVAAAILTLASALAVAVASKLTATAFDLENVIGLADLVVVSVVGGSLASVVVGAVTLALAAGSARRGWDLDNVNAPIVSAVGDMVTVPALYLATFLVDRGAATLVLGGVLTVATLATMTGGLRSNLQLLTLILRESLPIIVVTGVVLAVAGLVIEKRLEDFSALPALLILVPAALSGAGAVGSVLSSRLSTKLHLGLVSARAWPDRPARRDISTTVALALPVFLLNGLLAAGAAALVGLTGPGSVRTVAISVAGGMAATVVVVAIAYYGTVAATRLRVDPDTYGIPVVTSTVDLVGAYMLVIAIAVIA